MTIRLPIMLMCKNERKGVEDSDETTNVAQRHWHRGKVGRQSWVDWNSGREEDEGDTDG